MLNLYHSILSRAFYANTFSPVFSTGAHGDRRGLRPGGGHGGARPDAEQGGRAPQLAHEV